MLEPKSLGISTLIIYKELKKFIKMIFPKQLNQKQKDIKCPKSYLVTVNNWETITRKSHQYKSAKVPWSSLLTRLFLWIPV